MKAEGLQSHFKKGITTLCILSLLQGKKMYGYELVQETERISKGNLVLQEGTLYPVLYRLQEQGYISDEKVLVGKRMTRVYYSLTPAGVTYLQQIKAEYAQISEGAALILRHGERKDETA